MREHRGHQAGRGVTHAETRLRNFAVRRVNPFAGVLQVVETEAARAYSADGRSWQVQVLAQRPEHTWRSPGKAPPIEQFFNFGVWDEDGGLRRVPANPIMDIGSMSAAANVLIRMLTPLLQRLPFVLSDHYECWSTDRHGEPVALLATTEDRATISDLHPGLWRATPTADLGFISQSLLARRIPAVGDLGPRQHAELLERQVRKLGRHKAWFQRRIGGGGTRISPNQGPTADHIDSMPALGLKTDWDDPAEQALVDDYLAWQAPRLLMLQHIDDEQRARLERQACRQAVEVAAVFRLIPRIIDRDRIEAARVEATLRNAAD